MPTAPGARRRTAVEWPTVALAALCYGLWVLGTLLLPGLSPGLAFAATALAIALHSSLQHEATHGHPFRSGRLNHLLVAPALGLVVPFSRFRDQHLAHHLNCDLTDPYDDPESNFLDPARWARLAWPLRRALRANNTLAGRILLGPAISLPQFLWTDARAILRGDRAARAGWLWHLPALVLVIAWVLWAPMPMWQYLLAAYLGHGLIKIRTFCEHRAHQTARARSVIIDDHGPLSWLFLNNNLHAVHHMHPGVAWYDLPRLYRAGRARFQAVNQGYVYPGYGAVFRAHLFRAKDPVPHPLR